jgi:hypothetical protein
MMILKAGRGRRASLPILLYVSWSFALRSLVLYRLILLWEAGCCAALESRISCLNS